MSDDERVPARRVVVREGLVWFIDAVVDRGLMGSTPEEVVDALLTRAVRELICERYLERCDEDFARIRAAKEDNGVGFSREESAS